MDVFLSWDLIGKTHLGPDAFLSAVPRVATGKELLSHHIAKLASSFSIHCLNRQMESV